MVTNQNRLSAYLGFLLYFHKPQSYTLAITHRISKCLKHSFGSYLSYIILEHEKNMWQNSRRAKLGKIQGGGGGGGGGCRGLAKI